ncbi:MAG: ribosome small subunit-dependent GTPase A [Thiohalomonadaceae bacterium]
MFPDFSPLLPLGWHNHFLAQIPLESLADVRPARVVGMVRERFRVDCGDGAMTATLAGRYRLEYDAPPAVGDWVLLEAQDPVIIARLSPRTVIARRMAGGHDVQVIATNIDLMIIVGGLDAEFNVHRIERYLVMAAQAEVTPLVLLTKADLCADVTPMLAALRARLPPGAEVLAVNALSDPLAERLAPWLRPGTTLVVVGSSGVGKSTVVNNLLGHALQATGATRKDAKGRHTTTSRSLIRLPGGACIIDVPGMREVGLAGEGGVERQFGSITEFARACRFSDCSHQEEPGCAVRDAVERGEITPDAWQHYLKLIAEERHNVAEHERRQRERAFGRMVRNVLALKQDKRG